MNILHVCPCCGKTMNIHPQQSLSGGRTWIEAECVNAECPIYMVTLEEGQHQQLTQDEIENWKRINLRVRASVSSGR